MIHRASAIFISTAEPAYLATRPRHSRSRAQKIVDQMQLGMFVPVRITNLEDALSCTDDLLAIGAYDRGLYFSFPDEMYGCVEDLDNQIIQKLCKQYSRAHILAIELNNTKRYFGYVLYRRGKLERHFVGDMVRGIFINEGQVQPEEKPLFDRLNIAADPEPYQHGESLVKAMMGSFIGPPNKEAMQKLQVEIFE